MIADIDKDGRWADELPCSSTVCAYSSESMLVLQCPGGRGGHESCSNAARIVAAASRHQATHSVMTVVLQPVSLIAAAPSTLRSSCR